MSAMETLGRVEAIVLGASAGGVEALSVAAATFLRVRLPL